MTIEELRQWLLMFPDDATVTFTPKKACGMGWPEWSDAHFGRDEDDDGNELNRVTIYLTGEQP